MFLRKPSVAWKVGSQDAPPGSLHPGPASPFPLKMQNTSSSLNPAFQHFHVISASLWPLSRISASFPKQVPKTVQERTQPQLEWLSSLLHGPGKAPSIDLSPCHWVKREHRTLSTGLLAASPWNQAFGDCLGVPH